MTTRYRLATRVAGAVLLAVALVAVVFLRPTTGHAASTRYEAENATISQGTVATNHTGFSGTGFVDYTNVAGSYVQFTVSAAQAGTATLSFRYANGSTASRPMDISVNGTVVSAGLAFPPTTNWDTWQTVTITASLPAGSSTVRATATGSAGGPNLDFLDLDIASSNVYQAENATISQGVVTTNHAGFTGTGFVDYTNVAGSYVQFAVTIPATGTATLTFRYANGSTASRPMDISVNGTVVAPAVAFPPTTNWDTWQTVSVTATVSSGTNTIRATATTSAGGPNLDALTVASTAVDWSVALVESTMTRFTPGTLGSWGYQTGLFLYGEYLVYQRTHDPRYLSYIKSWVDRFVDSTGTLSPTINSLDSMLSGRLLVVLYRETGDPRYQTAAATIRNRLNTYPRTTDGGFWHADTSSRAHQLWSDGTFMLNPFLAEYGRQFNDSTYANNETAHQLEVYASHLQQSSGLMRHAYDEAKVQTWADPVTGLSPEVWCRADGWFGMALIDVLEVLPVDHPERANLLTILRNLVGAIRQYQDPVTGRWFEVVDKGTRSDNWTETSCSSMFTFVTSRAVERGYVDASFKTVATKGYQGVLTQISKGSDGLTNLTNVVVGTNVGDYTFYVGRTRATNDFHGLGSFLIMSEQLMRTG